MAPSLLQQRRTHNTLLFQKLLNLRDGSSPFTLILDTLEQSGKGALREFVLRGKISKSKIIYVSFCTPSAKVPFAPDVFLSASTKPLDNLNTLHAEIISHLPSPTSNQRTIIIIDTLNPLCSSLHTTPHLPTFLSSLLTSPSISLLATYHLDQPSPSSQHTSVSPSNAYQPAPLTTLIFLATAILRVRSVSHALTAKSFLDKSLEPPKNGLEQGREGILVGLGGTKGKGKEIIVEMEIRRKSGRGIVEAFIFTPSSFPMTNTKHAPVTLPTTADLATIVLLDEHPAFAPPIIEGNEPEEPVDGEVSFNLGLTEKQKRDRDGVVLPYFDAQKDGGRNGVGEGGRILYEMGAEDREDFDDEEDEV